MEHSSAKAFPKSGESIFPDLSTKSQRVVWIPSPWHYRLSGRHSQKPTPRYWLLKAPVTDYRS